MPYPPRYLIVPVLMTLTIFTALEANGFNNDLAVAQTLEVPQQENTQQEFKVSSEEKLAEAARLIEQAQQQFLVGQYEEMLVSSEQSLAIAHEIGHRHLEMRASGSLGLAYVGLRRFGEAIGPIDQGIAIARELGDRVEEKDALESLGFSFLGLGREQEAIFRSPSSFSFARDTDEDVVRGLFRQSLTEHVQYAARSIEFYAKGIDALDQSLAIAREMGSSVQNEPSFRYLHRMYYDLTRMYVNLGLDSRALGVQQQSLALMQEGGDRDGETGRLYAMGGIFGSIGRFLVEQDRSELAIVFFKKSVHLREDNREAIHVLPQQGRQIFIDKVLRDYSIFAELLQQQGQNSDAEAIVNLMELHGVEDQGGNALSMPARLELQVVEQVILDRYDRFIQTQTNADVDYSQIIQSRPHSDVEAFVNSPSIQSLVSQLKSAPRLPKSFAD